MRTETELHAPVPAQLPMDLGLPCGMTPRGHQPDEISCPHDGGRAFVVDMNYHGFGIWYACQTCRAAGRKVCAVRHECRSS
jgi:hypothetical protein